MLQIEEWGAVVLFLSLVSNVRLCFVVSFTLLTGVAGRDIIVIVMATC